jgi:gluconokinase
VVVIIMGAAGAGKSTVGAALAARLGWPFIDADDYHTAANIARMREGVGLSDEDRGPWLVRVRQAILQHHARRQAVVVACSALKRRYREILTAGVDHARLVYLQADEQLLKNRLQDRRGHFAGPALAETQLRDLEAPEGEALNLDASLSPLVLVNDIRRAFNI